MRATEVTRTEKRMAPFATTQIESTFLAQKGKAYEDGAYIFTKNKKVHFALIMRKNCIQFVWCFYYNTFFIFLQ